VHRIDPRAPKNHSAPSLSYREQLAIIALSPYAPSHASRPWAALAANSQRWREARLISPEAIIDAGTCLRDMFHVGGSFELRNVLLVIDKPRSPWKRQTQTR